MGHEINVFKNKEGKFVKTPVQKPELTGDQVLIRMTYSGCCGTDLHFLNADMVLGHEGVGIVEELAEGCKVLKKGDRVGYGYFHDTCGHCNYCVGGFETMCLERKMFAEADLDQGSFSHQTIWREAFLFKIPDAIDSADAAPLQCGGSTVYNALHLAEAKPHHRVGVIGIGGLGHLAIQFAAKMGCEVVAFSGTDSKKEESLKLGASEFYAVKGLKELKIKKPIDILIVTTSAQPDWNMFIGVMARGGIISPLSVDSNDLKFPYLPLIQSTLRIQGGVLGTRLVHRQMLDFAAHHDIKPIKQIFPMTPDGISECIKTLEDGKMRYRGVLAVQ